jgi:hypothetical protein
VFIACRWNAWFGVLPVLAGTTPSSPEYQPDHLQDDRDDSEDEDHHPKNASELVGNPV